MSTAWPPAPDLASIKELVRSADVECLIENGAPADEYDGEAVDLFAVIARFATAELTIANLLPVIELIWVKSFNLTGSDLASRRAALNSLATQIALFFGPEVKPQVRNGSS